MHSPPAQRHSRPERFLADSPADGHNTPAAIASGGDPRRLCDHFGLSIQHATRYTAAIAEPLLRP